MKTINDRELLTFLVKQLLHPAQIEYLTKYRSVSRLRQLGQAMPRGELSPSPFDSDHRLKPTRHESENEMSGQAKQIERAENGEDDDENMHAELPILEGV